jgi:hypothetical protein
MTQRRTVHNKEIGDRYGSRIRFLIERGQGHDAKELFARLVWREEHSYPPRQGTFLVHRNLLPAFRRHLDRLISEMDEIEKASEA